MRKKQIGKYLNKMLTAVIEIVSMGHIWDTRKKAR
jgi:hypothetical protein